MDEEFKSEILNKLDMMTTALTRLAEAQVRTSVIEFAKLNEGQKCDYWEAIVDLRENGWSSVFESQEQKYDDEVAMKVRQDLYDENGLRDSSEL